MVTTYNPGFPRIDVKRELKFALEAYWHGKSKMEALQHTGQQLRQRALARPKKSMINGYIP